MYLPQVYPTNYTLCLVLTTEGMHKHTGHLCAARQQNSEVHDHPVYKCSCVNCWISSMGWLQSQFS